VRGGSEVQELIPADSGEAGDGGGVVENREAVDARVVEFLLPPGTNCAGGKRETVLWEDVRKAEDRAVALEDQNVVQVANRQRAQHR
jgi:hypothetical protein